MVKIFKSVISFLFKDIQWKLLSLGLAFVLWLVGMYVNNPPSVEPFHRGLLVSNVDALSRDNIVLLNEQALRAEQITVSVRAPQSDLAELNRFTENIIASIDLRHINPQAVLDMIEESGKPVTLSMDVFTDIFLEGYERINTRPRTVDVELDVHVRQTHEVRVILEGEVREGYGLLSVDCVNKTVIVSGAKSITDEVHTVQCVVNVENADRDIEQTVRLVALNRDGEDITGRAGLELSVRETQVYAGISPYKTVNLSVGWTGAPALNRTVTDIRISPQSVTVIGPWDILHTVETILLEELDLSFANETQTHTRDIAAALPDNRLVLFNGGTEAVVTVVIEPMQSREYVFPVGEIQILGLPVGAVQLTGSTDAVRFSVIGAETVMAGLAREHIRVSLNLTGLAIGEQSVPLTITLPAGISLIGEPPSLDLLLSTPDPNEPVEMPEEIPEETEPDEMEIPDEPDEPAPAEPEEGEAAAEGEPMEDE
jgi:YbbR domain-containing protein